MARVTVPVTSITRSGIAPAAETTGDPVNFHSVSNSGRMFLLVRNADGVDPHDVTVHFSQTVDGQAVTARTYTIPLTSSRYIGPFPTVYYGSTLNVDVDDAQLFLSAYLVSE